VVDPDPAVVVEDQDLLRRLHRRDEAALAYREALELASTDAERRYLTRRLAETTSS
jgi:RNA polymerase sigma-70 factor (ECF subfamily)